MRSQTLLLAFTGMAAANLDPLPADAVKHAIKPRQTDVDSARACMSAIDAFVTDMPTPAAAFGDWAADQADETDACKVSLPNSLTSAFSSYSRAASSWWAANSNAWTSALSDCPELATMTGNMGSVPTCDADGRNAGHRETASGAAVGLAGLLGVFALL